MKHPTKISAFQFYFMLFLSRVVISITVNAQTLGRGNLLETIFSSLMLFAGCFLLVLPLFWLNRRYPEKSLPAIAEQRMGGFGFGISAIYGVFFLVMNTFSLSMFLALLLNTMDPAASKWSIAIILTGIALYGAIKGIETISRAAICIFVLFALGMAAIFTALSPNVTLRYVEPLWYDGAGTAFRGFFVFASRCTSIAEFAVLMPFVTGRKKLGFAVFNGGITLFLSILLFFIVSCLGEYAYLQIFPAYTLAAMSEIAGIQRLDALFIGLCMMTLVIRIACGLFGISECVSRMVKPRLRSVLLAASAAISVLFSLWITEDARRAGVLFRTEYLLAFTTLTSVLLPVIIWIAELCRKERKAG